MKRDKFAPIPAGFRGDVPRERVVYQQDHKKYNEAQSREKLVFLELLHNSIGAISRRRVDRKRGRPEMSLADMLFCCVLKSYEAISSRRLNGDMQFAQEMGYIIKIPQFTTLNKYIRSKVLTKYLYELIKLFSLPLKGQISHAAIDSSGISTDVFTPWVKVKENFKRRKDFKKLHIIVDVDTCMVLGARVTSSNFADIKMFEELVRRTHKELKYSFVSGDKAYNSREAHRICGELGIMPFLMFKKNTTSRAGGDRTWHDAFRMFKDKPEQYLQQYHKRSKVEATFSMIKRKFLHFTRAKSEIGQENEILCKIIAHNICVLNSLEVKGEENEKKRIQLVGNN